MLESATASAIERPEWCKLNLILAQTRGFALRPGELILPDGQISSISDTPRHPSVIERARNGVREKTNFAK
jgi:hypothetical protein